MTSRTRSVAGAVRIPGDRNEVALRVGKRTVQLTNLAKLFFPKAGLDLNCGQTYAALGNAVRQGLVTEAQVDVSLKRLMLSRMRLGEFDPPASVRWAQIPYKVNQAPEHDRSQARASAFGEVIDQQEHALPAGLQLVGDPGDLSYVVGYGYHVYSEPGKDREVASRCKIGAQQAPIADLELDAKQRVQNINR